MIFLLGQFRHLVGERQGLGEIPEPERPLQLRLPILLDEAPVGKLRKPGPDSAWSPSARPPDRPRISGP